MTSKRTGPRLRLRVSHFPGVATIASIDLAPNDEADHDVYAAAAVVSVKDTWTRRTGRRIAVARAEAISVQATQDVRDTSRAVRSAVVVRRDRLRAWIAELRRQQGSARGLRREDVQISWDVFDA